MFGVFFCTFMPCHREMALSGLNARSVLRDRSAVRLALPSMAKLSMETCKHIQTKKTLVFPANLTNLWQKFASILWQENHATILS